ncbi:Nuclear pore complex protein Nup58 [Frankliniella fusca]|uniref:Nuclear pore complex protein Nup58 n=1 Tax=Frankliniella fusca TaxID=407009 RepID=A0AAE1LD60_9NEOP|nr:Nuclear pore complex protein Nup58 [Frankliniella fusca]
MSFNFNTQQPTGAGTLGGRPAAPTFGAATAAPAFGAPTAAPAFGAATAAPAFGAATAAPSFGAATAAPSFGAATAAPAFGTATAAPAFGATSAAPSFGAATAAPSFGVATAAPSFGVATAAPSFGAVTATSAAPAFGAPTVATSTPSFGAAAPTASAPSAFGQSFGAPASSVGVVAPQPQASLFATPSAAKPTGLTTQPATSSTLFAAPQATPGLFGATSTAPATSSTGLFSGLATSKPSSQFGTTVAPTSLNFAAGSSFNTLAPASTATAGFSLGGPTAAAAAPAPSVGLGGVATTSSSGLTSLSGLAGTQTTRTEAKSPKETPIPDDIAKGVETFRQYVKKQKSFSSEIARCSSKPLLKVQEDTDAMKLVLTNSSAGLQRLKSIADKLKADTAKALQHTEMAQRTHETPAGLQYDNTAPLQYFAELVAGFERDIKLFRQEIENAERHVHSRVQITSITPAELTQSMRRLYDSFVALAGRLHTVHSQVKAQKEQYLSLRKYILNDASDVFDESARNRVNAIAAFGGASSGQPSKTMVGPTPFSALNSQHGFGLLTAGVAASTRQNFPGVGPLGK